MADEQPEHTLLRLKKGLVDRATVGRKTIPVDMSQFIEDEAEERDGESSSSESEDEEMRDFIAPEDEEEIIEPSSSSSSSSGDEKKKKKKKHHHHHRHNKRKRSSSPTADVAVVDKKKLKIGTDRISEDSKLVAPIPIVRFLQSRQIRKACGRCDECKKPPCGTCKACIQNQKHPKPTGNRDRRRCEMLKCKHDQSAPDVVVIPGIPLEKEEISKMLQKVSSQLAEMSAFRNSPDFNVVEYDGLVAKMRQLHDALAAIKNRKARQKTKFPACFHDAFGVVAELEKKRLKFAKFVVRARSGEECRTFADKCEMRDDLEEMIAIWCKKRAKNLAPVSEREAYDKLLTEGRGL